MIFASRFERNGGWHGHPELEVTGNLGVKDVVGDGNTAVSAGGCGMLTLERPVSIRMLLSNVKYSPYLLGRIAALAPFASISPFVPFTFGAA